MEKIENNVQENKTINNEAKNPFENKKAESLNKHTNNGQSLLNKNKTGEGIKKSNKMNTTGSKALNSTKKLKDDSEIKLKSKMK